LHTPTLNARYHDLWKLLAVVVTILQLMKKGAIQVKMSSKQVTVVMQQW
jgi:hypothetical protein